MYGKPIEVCKIENRNEKISYSKPKYKYGFENLKKFLYSMLVLKNQYEETLDKAKKSLKELKELKNVI